MRDKTLRAYVRESILLEKRKGRLGGGGSFGSIDLSGGPKKWFEDFMSSHLDAVGEKIADKLSDKLSSLLPDSLKDRLSSQEGGLDEVSVKLTKVVDGWIDVAEDHRDKEFSKAEKRQIYSTAMKSFAKHSKATKNVDTVYYLVKKDLDNAYVDRKTGAKT